MQKKLYTVKEHIIQLEDDIIKENYENNTDEELDEKPKPKGKPNT